MAGTTTNNNNSDWRLSLSEIPEVFADITPVDVLDKDTAVASIDYSTGFVMAYGYMRAILRRNEQSRRALKLSATCLQLNPANFTVWHFRRLCLAAVHSDNENDTANSTTVSHYITSDLEMAASLGGDNPKNYQVWYHRRALLELLDNTMKGGGGGGGGGDGDMDDRATATAAARATLTQELEYINDVLRHDSKNYHAWSHRQWVVVTIAAATKNKDGDDDNDDNSIWKLELDYVNFLIGQDSRNNSAWNHRWFVMHRGAASTGIPEQNQRHGLTADLADREMAYAIASTKVDTDNESSWRYFVAIVKEQICAIQDGAMVMALLSKALGMVDDVRASSSSGTTTEIEHPHVSPQLTSAAVDLLEYKADPTSIERAIQLAESLANEFDTVRVNYWNYRIRELRALSEKPRIVESY